MIFFFLNSNCSEYSNLFRCEWFEALLGKNVTVLLISFALSSYSVDWSGEDNVKSRKYLETASRWYLCYQFSTITHQVSCSWYNICKAQTLFKKNIILKERFQSVEFQWNLGSLNNLCHSCTFKFLWFSAKFTTISNFLSTSELWM